MRINNFKYALAFLSKQLFLREREQYQLRVRVKRFSEPLSLASLEVGGVDDTDADTFS